MRQRPGLKSTMNILERIETVLNDLFPLNRSLSGAGVRETLTYLSNNFSFEGEIKSIKSGTKVFDWVVPEEWAIESGYILNGQGEKIIDINDSNLHVMSYSTSVDKVVGYEELMNHLHTLPQYPDRIPYRTTYYKRNWGFCCEHNKVLSSSFVEPFTVYIDSSHRKDGVLNWLECVKTGESDKEILISTYCCHPSMANDNLSGVILAALLFEFLNGIDTKFTYRLVVLPETIGALSFLSQADVSKIIGGMVLSCVAGPDKVSLKEGFDRDHFMNKSAHLALQSVRKDYTVYPFSPDGSDERQYSTQGFRIVTPSIHKSKYYEYSEYHTSADNLEFVKAESLEESLKVHKRWIELIESYCYPKIAHTCGELQLGRRSLYPETGGAINQSATNRNGVNHRDKIFRFENKVALRGEHIDAFGWLTHLADGTLSNFEIAEQSGVEIDTINEAIAILFQQKLLELV